MKVKVKELTAQSGAWHAVYMRAQGRAAMSEKPSSFMNDFEAHLSKLLSNREEEVLAGPRTWHDPTSEAARVEALCAYRAIKHWGTDYGMCTYQRPKR